MRFNSVGANRVCRAKDLDIYGDKLKIAGYLSGLNFHVPSSLWRVRPASEIRQHKGDQQRVHQIDEEGADQGQLEPGLFQSLVQQHAGDRADMNGENGIDKVQMANTCLRWVSDRPTSWGSIFSGCSLKRAHLGYRTGVLRLNLAIEVI